MRTFLLLALSASVFAQQSNKLTAKEIADGWILLYDGESSFGWTPEGDAEWRTTSDGYLAAQSGGRGQLKFDSLFGDFELRCEVQFRIGKSSGLVINGIEIPAPSDKHAERWHFYDVTVTRGELNVMLDGKRFFRREVLNLGLIAIGYSRGDRIELRDVKLRPLGLQPLFDGKTLAGWHTVAADRAEVPAVWGVKDAMIHVEHGPGQLETESEHKDFILQLDVRANSTDPRLHPNSGVFLRGVAKGFWSGYESQIRNEYKDEDRNSPVDFGTGAIYHYQPARRIVANDNEFFTKTILARGRHFAIWVNGYPVTSWEDPHPEGSNVPNQEAKLTGGTISLQAHDPTTNLDFRNLRIADLP